MFSLSFSIILLIIGHANDARTASPAPIKSSFPNPFPSSKENKSIAPKVLSSIIECPEDFWVHEKVKGPTIEDIRIIINQEAEDKDDDDDDDTDNESELRSHVHKFHGKPLLNSIKEYASFRLLDPITSGELIRQQTFTPKQYASALVKLYDDVKSACEENGELDGEQQCQLENLRQRIEKALAFALAVEYGCLHEAKIEELEGDPKAAYVDRLKKRYQKAEDQFSKYIESLEQKDPAKDDDTKEQSEQDPDKDDEPEFDFDAITRAVAMDAPSRNPAPPPVPRKRESVTINPSVPKRRAFSHSAKSSNSTPSGSTTSSQSTTAFDPLMNLELSDFSTSAACNQTMQAITAAFKSQRGQTLAPSEIFSPAKLKLEMSSKIDALERKLSTKTLLAGRKPLFKAGFLPSFDSDNDYRYPKYPSPMRTLMEYPKANLPQQLSEMRMDNRWSAVPTTTMMIDILHKEGWNKSIASLGSSNSSLRESPSSSYKTFSISDDIKSFNDVTVVLVGAFFNQPQKMLA